MDFPNLGAQCRWFFCVRRSFSLTTINRTLSMKNKSLRNRVKQCFFLFIENNDHYKYSRHEARCIYESSLARISDFSFYIDYRGLLIETRSDSNRMERRGGQTKKKTCQLIPIGFIGVLYYYFIFFILFAGVFYSDHMYTWYPWHLLSIRILFLDVLDIIHECFSRTGEMIFFSGGIRRRLGAFALYTFSLRRVVEFMREFSLLRFVYLNHFTLFDA